MDLRKVTNEELKNSEKKYTAKVYHENERRQESETRLVLTDRGMYVDFPAHVGSRYKIEHLLVYNHNSLTVTQMRDDIEKIRTPSTKQVINQKA